LGAGGEAGLIDASSGRGLHGLLAIVSPASCAFFLDVDGTLLDIRPQPRDVVADTSLLDLLSALRAEVADALALVSGRAIEDLDRIFAPLTFTAAGLHGCDLRFADGSRFGLPDRVMDKARPALRHFVASHPGLLLEDKGATLAVHYRQRPDLGPIVIDALTRVAGDADYRVQQGKMVVELKPPGFDKGGAITRLMQDAPFKDRQPVFIGDDLTDEAGFVAVNAMGGFSVRVGAVSMPSAARYRVATVAALRALLAACVVGLATKCAAR